MHRRLEDADEGFRDREAVREGLSERVRGVAGYEEGGVGGDVGEDGGEGVLRGGEGVGEVVDGGGAGGGGEVGVCCLGGVG